MQQQDHVEGAVPRDIWRTGPRSPRSRRTEADESSERPGEARSQQRRSHRSVVINGTIEHAGASRSFASTTHLVSGTRSIELLAAADDQVALDLIGSAEHDGALFVTVTIQFLLRNAAWTEDATDLGSWSTVVLADCSTPFAVTISDDTDDSAEARGTIHNHRSPDSTRWMGSPRCA